MDSVWKALSYYQQITAFRGHSAPWIMDKGLPPLCLAASDDTKVPKLAEWQEVPSKAASGRVLISCVTSRDITYSVSSLAI